LSKREREREKERRIFLKVYLSLRDIQNKHFFSCNYHNSPSNITQEFHVMILFRNFSHLFFSFFPFFPPFIHSIVFSMERIPCLTQFQYQLQSAHFFFVLFYNQLYVKIMHICKSVLKYYNLIFYSRLLSAFSNSL